VDHAQAVLTVVATEAPDQIEADRQMTSPDSESDNNS
jgi:hypothetical protein